MRQISLLNIVSLHASYLMWIDKYVYTTQWGHCRGNRLVRNCALVILMLRLSLIWEKGQGVVKGQQGVTPRYFCLAGALECVFIGCFWRIARTKTNCVHITYCTSTPTSHGFLNILRWCQTRQKKKIITQWTLWKEKGIWNQTFWEKLFWKMAKK